jgi:hypothetical protein
MVLNLVAPLEHVIGAHAHAAKHFQKLRNAVLAH